MTLNLLSFPIRVVSTLDMALRRVHLVLCILPSSILLFYSTCAYSQVLASNDIPSCILLSGNLRGDWFSISSGGSNLGTFSVPPINGLNGGGSDFTIGLIARAMGDLALHCALGPAYRSAIFTSAQQNVPPFQTNLQAKIYTVDGALLLGTHIVLGGDPHHFFALEAGAKVAKPYLVLLNNEQVSDALNYALFGVLGIGYYDRISQTLGVGLTFQGDFLSSHWTYYGPMTSSGLSGGFTLLFYLDGSQNTSHIEPEVKRLVKYDTNRITFRDSIHVITYEPAPKISTSNASGSAAEVNTPVCEWLFGFLNGLLYQNLLVQPGKAYTFRIPCDSCFNAWFDSMRRQRDSSGSGNSGSGGSGSGNSGSGGSGSGNTGSGGSGSSNSGSGGSGSGNSGSGGSGSGNSGSGNSGSGGSGSGGSGSGNSGSGGFGSGNSEAVEVPPNLHPGKLPVTGKLRADWSGQTLHGRTIEIKIYNLPLGVADSSTFKINWDGYVLRGNFIARDQKSITRSFKLPGDSRRSKLYVHLIGHKMDDWFAAKVFDLDKN